MKYILQTERDENDVDALWLYTTDADGEAEHGTQLAGDDSGEEDVDTTVLASFEVTADDICNAIRTLGSIEQLVNSIVNKEHT